MKMPVTRIHMIFPLLLIIVISAVLNMPLNGQMMPLSQKRMEKMMWLGVAFC
jgi:lipopolysaccharide export LptBFGC system permease protein LptF